jgi:hypothetical protein
MKNALLALERGNLPCNDGRVLLKIGPPQSLGQRRGTLAPMAQMLSGLTMLSALLQRLPKYDYLYLGDSARSLWPAQLGCRASLFMRGARISVRGGMPVGRDGLLCRIMRQIGFSRGGEAETVHYQNQVIGSTSGQSWSNGKDGRTCTGRLDDG